MISEAKIKEIEKDKEKELMIEYKKLHLATKKPDMKETTDIAYKIAYLNGYNDALVHLIELEKSERRVK